MIVVRRNKRGATMERLSAALTSDPAPLYSRDGKGLASLTYDLRPDGETSSPVRLIVDRRDFEELERRFRPKDGPTDRRTD